MVPTATTNNTVQIPVILHPSLGPNLKHGLLSWIVTTNFQNSPDVEISPETLAFFDSVVKGHWDQFKEKAPADLKAKMLEAEDIAQFDAIVQSLSQQEREDLMKQAPDEIKELFLAGTKVSVANQLFQQLALKLNTKVLFGNNIPVDVAAYDLLKQHQKELDDALVEFWNNGIFKSLLDWDAMTENIDEWNLRHKQLESLKTAEEIRAFLTNPCNKFIVENANRLIICNCNLKIIPPEVSLLTGLKRLDLSGNQFTNIPESICKLPNLECLILNENLISKLPDLIGNLAKLTELQLQNNPIAILPGSLGNLTELKYLNTCNTDFVFFPSSLNNLNKLEKLDLGYHLSFIYIGIKGKLTLDSKNAKLLFSKSIECVNYECQSTFTQFLKSAILDMNNHEKNKHNFSLVSPEFQQCFLRSVFPEARNNPEMLSNFNNPKWINDNLLKDMGKFRKALESLDVALMTLAQYEYVSIDKTNANKIYDEIYLLAGKPETDDPRTWAKDHAQVNMLRLMDAIIRSGVKLCK